tara:strand:- start:151 stop:501 length:351 start_codon:yes stop_codon:yes gene_type:complete
MNEATQVNSLGWKTISDMLVEVTYHKLGKAIRIYSNNIKAHNLTVDNVQELLPSNLTCFMSKVTSNDIMKAKIEAKLKEEDYVKPLPYLVITESKRLDIDTVKDDLADLLGNKASK